MSINHWPVHERPREKLLSKGSQALDDSELLAIFLRTGTKGCSAVDLARQLMGHFGSLSNILNASLEEFQSRPGLGIAKYTQLMASKELTRRALAEEIKSLRAFHNPQQVKDYLRLTIGQRDTEIFFVLFLSNQNHILATEELFQGTLGETHVYPREIARKCLAHNAGAIIVAHNHPSGSLNPSQADCDLTKTIKNTLKLIDTRLLDHFIVTQHDIFSFAERGLL